MEYPLVLFLHVLLGVIWAGGAISVGLFIMPSVLEAGPAGGAVMAGVVKRKFPIVMTAAAATVVLTGLRLYSIRFSTEWVARPEGIVLSIGGLLGLGAFAIGVFVQKPAVEHVGKLAAEIAATGAPPTPEKAAEMKAARARLAMSARLTAWHLIGAVSMMALHRFASLF